MSIRKIEYQVTAEGIMPSVVQSGGVQGEHNATELAFAIDGGLLALIRETANAGQRIVYRFDAYSGVGAKFSTEPQELPDGDSLTLKYRLENRLTRDGGNLRVYLVITAIKEDETTLDLYSFPALIRLANVPAGRESDEENHESISTLAEVAKTSAAMAVDAKDTALIAKEQTVLAHTALTEGAEFVFDGGDAKGAVSIDLTVDAELNGESLNPVQNKAVARETTAIKNSINELVSNVGANSNRIIVVENQMTEDISLVRTELNEHKEAIADHIVEQGTSGIWTYRKWASGVAECWGIAETVMLNVQNSWTGTDADGKVLGVFTSDSETTAQINYPFEFAAVPIEFVKPCHSGMNYWVVTTGNSNTADKTAKYQIARGSKATDVQVKLAYHVIGRWK